MRYFFNPGSTNASDHKVAYSWWSCDKLKKIKTASEKYQCKISQFWKSATAVLTVVFQSALFICLLHKTTGVTHLSQATVSKQWKKIKELTIDKLASPFFISRQVARTLLHFRWLSKDHSKGSHTYKMSQTKSRPITQKKTNTVAPDCMDHCNCILKCCSQTLSTDQGSWLTINN